MSDQTRLRDLVARWRRLHDAIINDVNEGNGTLSEADYVRGVQTCADELEAALSAAPAVPVEEERPTKNERDACPICDAGRLAAWATDDGTCGITCLACGIDFVPSPPAPSTGAETPPKFNSFTDVHCYVQWLVVELRFAREAQQQDRGELVKAREALAAQSAALAALEAAWLESANASAELARRYDQAGGDDAGNGFAFRKETRIWRTCAAALRALRAGER